jgi:hypothetical protein
VGVRPCGTDAFAHSFNKRVLQKTPVECLCNLFLCGGAAPTPPAETAVSALCVRILSILVSVFASLFAKREWGSGQRPDKKKIFAQTLQMSVTKKVTKNFKTNRRLP